MEFIRIGNPSERMPSNHEVKLLDPEPDPVNSTTTSGKTSAIELSPK